MLLFAISGMAFSEVVFAKNPLRFRILLGLTAGLLLLTWLPSLFALAVGFTAPAQILAAIVALLLFLGSICVLIRRRKRGKVRPGFCKSDLTVLLLIVPVLVLCFSLLHTHVLKSHADGSLWVGQVTYGDLAMHLGFLTSIGTQGTFPPEYSIFPGHALNYPFLCETSGASLYLLGATVRQAYILTAAYAFVVVVLGIYCFFRQWLKRNARAVLATVLFLFGGGFGFYYFFDLSKTGGLLTSALDTYGQTVSQTLLDGFYQTPTNIPALGLRWVNPIVDMLIPQRATLFGWAILFPCLLLLHGFAFENKRENRIPLAVFAGLLPLIHTHSFLALGVISAVYCVTDLISVRFEKKRLLDWLTYAAIACVLAAPQLFLFTFRQTSESSMVRFHLNWANNADSYLWFYIKNLGLIFLLMPFALLILGKRDRKIYSGALVLWLIAECIEFQPNDYDNNKLLFIWYAFTCGLVAKLLLVLYDRAVHRIHRKFSVADRQRAQRIGIALLICWLLLYFLYKIAFDSEGGFAMRPGTALTLFFVSGLLLSLCIGAFVGSHPDRNQMIRLSAPTALSLWMIGLLLCTWLKQYTYQSYSIARFPALFTVILGFASLLLLLFAKVCSPKTRGLKQFCGASVAITAASFVLLFTMTVSAAMTIVRELKSEYQVYTKNEAALAEQIKSETEPDAVILANSYHWNLVTPLTGRSIVTGTGTFLYYHGIETSEREADVRMMFEQPAACAELFEKYNVRYVLMSNAERMTYDVDYAYFDAHGAVVAQNDAGMLYKLNP